jgi:tripartite motif-containing protein 9/67
MEEELKCAYCNDFYCNPVLLPCFHSLCYACALHLQEKFTTTPQAAHTNPLPSNPNSQHQTTVGKYQSSYHANQQSIDNISSAIVNAAKSASNMISALNNSSSSSNSTSPTSSSSISPHSSLSAELTYSSQNRALSVTDFGSSVVSDLDKLSVFSENDSGLGGLSTTTLTALINSSNGGGSAHHHHGSLNQTGNSSCSSNSSSRPSSSYISTGSSSSSSGLSPTDFASRHKRPSPSTSSASLPLPPPPPLPACSLYSTYLPCPKCTRMIYMDDMGVDSLTKNTCLENIVERYTEARKLTLKCQMCPPSNEQSSNNGQRVKEKDAVFMCEQCEIYYCEECKDAFHPMRGPLQKHTLVLPKVGRDLVRRKNRSKESKCAEHATENANYYCLLCKCSCCNLCVTEDSTHLNHQIQPINGFCKSQKVSGFFY